MGEWHAAWTTWAKGGPALRNHSGCSLQRASGAWEDGAWLGNGLSGAILRWDPANPRALRLDLGRADIWDRRAPGSAHATGNAMFDRPRLPVGYLTLNATAPILHGEWRVSLGGGALRGTLLTSAGRIDFLLAALVPPREVLVLQVNASGSEALALHLVALPGSSARQSPPASYAPNPPPNCTAGEGGALLLCAQALLACDCGYATAVARAPLGAGWLAAIHIANDYPLATSSATAAATAVAAAAALAAPGGLAAALADQAAWWGAFFRASFVSIPDTALEGAYVLQTAKVGAATRAHGTAMDLQGPWWQRSGWQLYWWDMNVPVTYWPLYAAARFDLAATLTDFLLSNTSQLAANPLGIPDAAGIGGASSYDLVGEYAVVPGGMLGNFPWIMHNVYMHAAFTGNASMMRGVVFPLLRSAINVYRAFAFRGSDGLLHLPASSSPEYPYPHGPTNDTHYDLALFFWGARTLLALAQEFSIADPLIPFWADVLRTLAPYPVDEHSGHGFNVSLGVGFDVPHRHFSHLFAMFPLHNMAFEDADGGSAATRDLLSRSLDHWVGLTCPAQLCPNGFTYDGAISMSALMGASNSSRRQDAAALAGNFVRSGLLHASTMYSEGHQPCLESPLGLASALQDMLLQSWGGRLRVFPGVPDSWAGAVAHGLAGEGGWRVSAVRAGGRTQWVALTAAPAAPASGAALLATLSAPTLAPPFATVPEGVQVQVLPSGDLRFEVPLGGTVVVYTAGGGAQFAVRALPGNASEYNYWGMH